MFVVLCCGCIAELATARRVIPFVYRLIAQLLKVLHFDLLFYKSGFVPTH
jgi:hypothetical protein